jgi:hypothetical protein
VSPDPGQRKTGPCEEPAGNWGYGFRAYPSQAQPGGDVRSRQIGSITFGSLFLGLLIRVLTREARRFSGE